MISEKIYLYGEDSAVNLTTFRINENGELNGQGPRPAVLVCPGGGYFNCSDREAEPVALHFNVRGYHAFVLRYSTYDEGKNEFPNLSADADIAPNERTKHPAPVRDIAKAMLFIREHAKEWQVDTGRIAVCGFSAGGHNSAMYGVYWNKPLLTEYFGVDAEALWPAALFLGYPLTDYVFMDQVKKNPMDKRFFDNSNIAFLGESRPSEETLVSVSPARLVSADTPPTFLWATAGDNLVPVQHSLRMAHALADHKVPFEIHIFEEGDHGLSTATQACAVAKSQINADAAQWTALAGNWLDKRFALKLPTITPFEEMLAKYQK